MSFIEAIQSVFSNYANFSGRARRSEYWYFILFNFIVGFILGILQNRGIKAASVITGIFSLAVFIPSLAVSWRRFHDIGKSGLYYFFGLIPVIGWILVIYWMCKDSESGDNQYGVCPK